MYDDICQWSNLIRAYQLASKGKRGLPYVARFEHHLEEELFYLERELREQTYRPGRYQNFYIHEPKRRLISAAPFRDRVLHHALANVIEPLFESAFIRDSYANRRGKGNHRALDRCQNFARRFPFVLSCDIRQYFPAIDHDILHGILAKKISDDRVLRLIKLILASGTGVHKNDFISPYFPGDELFDRLRPTGLPIGNLTSQLWANVYLNSFDHFVKRELRVPGYVRYVDDFLLFGDGKEHLWEWKRAVTERLSQIRLQIHPGSHPRPTSEGIPFLGFIVFPNRRRLKNRKGFHFRKKLKKKHSKYLKQNTDFEDLQASVQGWINHVRYANTIGLRKAIFKDVFHLR